MIRGAFSTVGDLTSIPNYAHIHDYVYIQKSNNPASSVGRGVFMVSIMRDALLRHSTTSVDRFYWRIPLD